MQRIAENIRTLEVRLSEEIYSALGVLAKQREKFVAEAIKEKLEREKRRSLLIEGYQATFQEDLALAREFESDVTALELMLATEPLIASEWVTPEEDEAWAHL